MILDIFNFIFSYMLSGLILTSVFFNFLKDNQDRKFALLLGYGIIAFIIFIYYQVKMFRLFAKEKNYITLTVMAIYAVYGFMEVVFIRVDMNFTLLFMGMILFRFMGYPISVLYRLKMRELFLIRPRRFLCQPVGPVLSGNIMPWVPKLNCFSLFPLQ